MFQCVQCENLGLFQCVQCDDLGHVCSRMRIRWLLIGIGEFVGIGIVEIAGIWVVCVIVSLLDFTREFVGNE